MSKVRIVSLLHITFTVTLKVIETDDEYNLIKVMPFHSLGGMQGIKRYLLTLTTKVFNRKRSYRDRLVMAASFFSHTFGGYGITESSRNNIGSQEEQNPSLF